MLREVMSYHADQVQMSLNSESVHASVSVSSPENIAFENLPAKSKFTLIMSGDSICVTDQRSDLYCSKD